MFLEHTTWVIKAVWLTFKKQKGSIWHVQIVDEHHWACIGGVSTQNPPALQCRTINNKSPRRYAPPFRAAAAIFSTSTHLWGRFNGLLKPLIDVGRWDYEFCIEVTNPKLEQLGGGFHDYWKCCCYLQHGLKLCSFCLSSWSFVKNTM